MATSASGNDTPNDKRRPASASAPGARTMEVIAQSGVNETRSPARIARFLAAGLVAVLTILFALSQLGVSIPLLSGSRGASDRIFGSANDDPSLRALREGKPRPPPAAVAPPLAPKPTVQVASPDQQPLAHKEDRKIEQLADADKQQLAQLYASQDLSLAHKAPSATEASAVDRAAASLSAEQVTQTVAKFRSGYASCISGELKRNPNFVGGKIRVVATLASSGIVRRAEIQSDLPELARSVSAGPLGSCLVTQTRRIVFPSFAGDPIDVEIPLALSAVQ